MANPLYNELLELRYIPIDKIDEELPPESVVLYFKNLSQLDKRVSVEPIHGVQLDLLHQNPTIELEDFKATFCLGPSIYIPTVTITPIVDYVDPQYPVSLTVTGTISRTETNIPNEILVSYNNQTKTATLINNTDWTVTFDLKNVTLNSTELVTARGNSLDINTSIVSDFSETVERRFNITITPEVEECIPSVDKVSCLCLDISKSYKVTVDDETYSGSFENVVAFLDSRGLYAYPGGIDCDPCFNSRNSYSLTFQVSGPPPETLMSLEIDPNEILYTLKENGVPDKEIVLPIFLKGSDLLKSLLENVDGIFTLSNLQPNKEIVTFRNIQNKDRQLVFETTPEGIQSLGSVQFDGNIALNKTETTLTICFLPQIPVVCSASTSPVAAFNGLPLMEPGQARLFINGTQYSEQDLQDGNVPMTVESDLNTTIFKNKTEECLLVEFLYDGDEIVFPPSITPGIASESVPNAFRFSLAGQVFDPMSLDLHFETLNGIQTSNVLQESEQYNVVIRPNVNNPHPNWVGIVTYGSETFTLNKDNGYNVNFTVTIPANKSWNTKPYVYDFDITSDSPFTYQTGSTEKPSYFISVYTLTGASSTWTYNGVQEIVPANPNNPHFYYANNTLAKQNILTVQLPSIYSGLKTGAPFNATVSGSGLLTVDLGQSYVYNEGWTTASKISGAISLKNADNNTVAFLAYYTYVSGFELSIETSNNSGIFSPTTSISQRVNVPFTRFKIGPFPNVSKISLTVHQDGLGDARLVRETTILDVVNNYAYYTPPTPTVTYNPYVDQWSYKITTLLIRVEEGDPRFLTMMRQSKELKYTVTT